MSLEEFVKIPSQYTDETSGTIDLLVECKENPFHRWKSELDNQIIPYKREYNPKRMILLSAYDVPESGRKIMQNESIEVVAPFGPESQPATAFPLT